MSNADLKISTASFAQLVRKVRPYVGVLIFLLFAGIYGFVVYTINSLADPSVELSAVQSEVKALPVPQIDEEAVLKLQSLKDNSVNVQALFEQGRTNPFQE